MKPIKLTIQAFGPFATKEVVDFTELGTNPLFLINGPTGSGKTSILDAICFALYGETTSNERLGIQMRCDQASPELATEVTFEFQLGDNRYRVIRSPEQEVPKARGEGFTTRKHSASLYRIGEEEQLITAKTVQVKGEVTKLVGLNETQFRQVMVLPQGKFRELLLASSKEREAIFGQLFQTDMYKKIEYALKEKASSISKAKNDFDNQIRGALQVAESNSEAELEAHYQTAQSALSHAQQQENEQQTKLSAAEKEQQIAFNVHKQFTQLNEAQVALDQHLTSLNEHNSQKVKLDLALQASQLSVSYSQWQLSEKRCEELNTQFAQLVDQVDKSKQTFSADQTELEKVEQAASKLPELSSKQFELEQLKAKWLEKESLERQIQTEKSNKQQLDEKLAQYQLHKQNLINEAEQSEKELHNSRQQLELMPKLQIERITLERVEKDLTHLSRLYDQLKAMQSEGTQKQNLVEQSKAVYLEAVQNADKLEMCWHNAQAALLAQKLSSGQACPVCGSLEHPSPARLGSDDVSKQHVEQARQQERSALELHNKHSNELSNHQTRVEQQSQQIETLKKELGEQANARVADIKQQLIHSTEQIQRLKQIDVTRLEGAVKELRQRVELGESKIAEVKQQISAKSSSLTLLEQQLVKLNQQFSDKQTSLPEIEKQLEETVLLIEALNKSLHAARQKNQSSQLALKDVEGQFKSTQELCNKESETLKRAKESWQQSLDKSPFENLQDYLHSRLTDSEVDKLKKAVEEYQQKELKLKQTISDLHEALKGLEQPDLTAVAENLAQLKSAYQVTRSVLESSSALFKRVEKVKRDIETLHNKNRQLEQEYQVFGTLYDVASGKTGSRVSLHRFVLGVLLDDVLIQASQRLNHMSRGRYLLKRKVDGFKGSAGRGLDLLVEDGYTGKSRDVATLSGGESFMAALSLALGLSDVVQSYSGGIRLETLFIDEGFGSLDPESLDLALQTLIDLQQSGRTIGLISHVSELKEQMHLRLDIESSRTGSKIVMVGQP